MFLVMRSTVVGEDSFKGCMGLKLSVAIYLSLYKLPNFPWDCLSSCLGWNFKIALNFGMNMSCYGQRYTSKWLLNIAFKNTFKIKFCVLKKLQVRIMVATASIKMKLLTCLPPKTLKLHIFSGTLVDWWYIWNFYTHTTIHLNTQKSPKHKFENRNRHNYEFITERVNLAFNIFNPFPFILLYFQCTQSDTCNESKINESMFLFVVTLSNK